MLMEVMMMVMCVLVVMKEEFPGGGLDLVAPIIQVKRVVPPLPVGKK